MAKKHTATPEFMDDDSMMLTWENADHVYDSLINGGFEKEVRHDKQDLVEAINLNIKNFEESFAQILSGFRFTAGKYYDKSGCNKPEQLEQMKHSFNMVLHLLNVVKRNH
jgi:hypothetical protein